jgi:hypothetical protein
MSPRDRIIQRLLELLRMSKKDGKTRMRVGGFFRWWEDGPNGERINEQWFNNTATYVGLNYMLEVMFNSGSQLTSWKIGLINSTSFTGVSVNDTMASHGGWTEFTAYSGTTRPTWTPTAAASGVMVNSAAFTYAISSDGTLSGTFVTDTANKSPGNTGVLWATALQTRAVTNGSTLSGIYGITLTPSS